MRAGNKSRETHSCNVVAARREQRHWDGGGLGGGLSVALEHLERRVSDSDGPDPGVAREGQAHAAAPAEAEDASLALLGAPQLEDVEDGADGRLDLSGDVRDPLHPAHEVVLGLGREPVLGPGVAQEEVRHSDHEPGGGNAVRDLEQLQNAVQYKAWW